MSQPVSRELSPSKPAKAPSRYSSRAPSRPRHSRNSSRASLAYTPVAEDLLLPDGPIGEETAELLHELVHPHHREEEGALFGGHDDGDEEPQDDDSDASSLEWHSQLPWYKRPSSNWFLVFVPLGAAAMGASIAPKIEIFTQMVCDAYKPEYTGIGKGNDTGISLFGASVYGNDERVCATDPVVQAEVAKLSLALTTSLGILSCLTTAWWGALSDRYGRTRILSICILGMVMTDVNFIVVSHFHKVLPGGYWFIVFGPVLDGILGGMTASSAAVHAYIADCTPPEARSRTYSLFAGLLFSGIAVGPTIGSIIIRLTGSLLSIFYITAAVHILYALLVTTIMPESLSMRRMLKSRRLYNEQAEEARRAPGKRGVWAAFKKVFGFLSPLAMFYQAPAVVDSNPLRRPKKDRSLLLIAISFGSLVSVVGAYAFKFLYAQATFGWTAEQIGYWLSAVGFARAIYLTLILPVIIKFAKPKPKGPIQLPTSPDEPLQPLSSSSSRPPSHSPARSIKAEEEAHVLAFDLNLARGSLLVELTLYLLLPFAPSGLAFTALSVFGAFGAGFAPALQSVALGLYTQQGGTESGKLFGAWSVVQALSSQIIGPAVYGLTYMLTVAKWPTAVFSLAAVAVTTSLVALSLVRLPKPGAVDLEDFADEIPVDQDDALDSSSVPTIVVDGPNSKPSTPSL